MKLILFALCALVFVTFGSSNYIGVWKRVDNGVERSRWVANRWSKNECTVVNNGSYCNEERAAHASDTLARKLIANGEKGHKLNFPDDHTEVYGEYHKLPCLSITDQARKQMKNAEKSSKFLGVSYNKAASRWVAARCSKHTQKIVRNGSFDDEETAAHASDTLARKLMENGEEGHKLNFPDDYTEVYVNELVMSSQFLGVSYNKEASRNSRWVAARYSRHTQTIVRNGSYCDEETAAHASDTLARELIANGEEGHELNFPDDHTEVYPELRQNKRKRDHDTNVHNVPSTEKCPKNHALKRFKTTTAEYGCDSCGPSVRFPKGATMYGCRKCDFDLCENCHKPNFPKQ